jgi:hypothetical protein
MPRETKPTRRFGVFATVRGWLLADADSGETFETRTDAVASARRLAHVARWRGAAAEVVAQDRPGGALKVIDPPSPGGRLGGSEAD